MSPRQTERNPASSTDRCAPQRNERNKLNSYISFIRGINVGGKKIVKMADLRALYAGFGFENVTTYL